jgi:hypothetical protein
MKTRLVFEIPGGACGSELGSCPGASPTGWCAAAQATVVQHKLAPVSAEPGAQMRIVSERMPRPNGCPLKSWPIKVKIVRACRPGYDPGASGQTVDDVPELAQHGFPDVGPDPDTDADAAAAMAEATEPDPETDPETGEIAEVSTADYQPDPLAVPPSNFYTYTAP